jgi:hypothetical protein
MNLWTAVELDEVRRLRAEDRAPYRANTCHVNEFALQRWILVRTRPECKPENSYPPFLH